MTTEIEEEITQPVQVMQIICLALAIGPVVFAGVVFFGGIGPEGDPEPGVIAMMGVVMAGVMLVISPIMRRVTSTPTHAPGLSATQRLAAAYQTGLIVSSALNEGAAFMNVVAFMIEGSPWNLALVALLVVVNLMKFPTRHGVAEWIASQQRSQREEEHLTG